MGEKMIKTVLGTITPDSLGVTMTHEHLSLKYSDYEIPPENFQNMQKEPMARENLWWIRQNPYSHPDNLLLCEEEQAIIEEVQFYQKNGGSAIVENTTIGIDRNLPFLVKLAQQTGVHMIAGSGYYLGATHPADMDQRTLESLTAEMRAEVEEGIVIPGHDQKVMCGVLGELGCSWPLLANERKVLQAAAAYQSVSQCPVIIHPGRNREAPFEIMRVFTEAGGKASRTVMSHLDRTFHTEEDVLEFAKLGAYCEYDLFGIETSHYQINPNVDMPSDAERIKYIRRLVEEGYEERVVIAHDIHTKHRMMKYGGHGYSHILINVVPKMRQRGISEDVIQKILVSNPRQWLQF